MVLGEAVDVFVENKDVVEDEEFVWLLVVVAVTIVTEVTTPSRRNVESVLLQQAPLLS